MNDLKDKLIEIFCNVDDFNNVFINELRTHQLSDGTRKRIKPGSLNESEVMTIVIYFHLMRYRDFKHYNLFHVSEHMRNDFPGLVSYNRFVELMQTALLPLAVFLKTRCLGKCTGISYVNSSHIKILDFVLTPGNVDDRHPLLGSNLLEKIYGKLYGDKGYISQSIFEKLFIDGIHLITKLRKNMKNSLMLLSDKILLRKRALI